MSKLLTEQDYQRAAATLGCDVASIKAVAKVESSKSGFFDDGRPVILFEAHQFSRLTNHKYDAKYPSLSSRRWDRSLYKGGAAEYLRLNQAVTIDRNAALQSASYGKFQIMGFNYGACGFRNVEDFVNAMNENEGRHLDAFVQFIISNNMSSALKNHDWVTFARKYNGSGYAINKYDTKLAAAYQTFSKEPVQIATAPVTSAPPPTEPTAPPVVKPTEPQYAPGVLAAVAEWWKRKMSA